MLCINKVSFFNVVQWHKEGDHPNVAAYRTTPPDSILAADEEPCYHCGKLLKEHGLLPGYQDSICPGSFLLFTLDGAIEACLSPQAFHESYEELCLQTPVQPTHGQWTLARQYIAEVKTLLPELTAQQLFFLKTTLLERIIINQQEDERWKRENPAL